VNSFNIKGRKTIHSTLGVGVTIVVWLLVITCLAIKSIEVISGNNPTISVIYKDKMHLDEKNALNLGTEEKF
jgi:hypothetical protein